MLLSGTPETEEEEGDLAVDPEYQHLSSITSHLKTYFKVHREDL